MAAMAVMLGFLLIAFCSTTVAQPVLGKIWVGEFYGRIDAVKNISLRNVFRLRLAIGGNSDLSPFVRVNLTPEQYQRDFQPGAIIPCARVYCRLLGQLCPARVVSTDWRNRDGFGKGAAVSKSRKWGLVRVAARSADAAYKGIHAARERRHRRDIGQWRSGTY